MPLVPDRERFWKRVQAACRTTEEAKAAGGKVKQEPMASGGIGTQTSKVADPDGWLLAFVDNEDFLGELCKTGSLKSGACPKNR